MACEQAARDLSGTESTAVMLPALPLYYMMYGKEKVDMRRTGYVIFPKDDSNKARLTGKIKKKPLARNTLYCNQPSFLDFMGIEVCILPVLHQVRPQSWDWGETVFPTNL